MKIRFLILFLTILNFGCSTKAQRAVDYRFVVKDKIIVDTLSKMYAYSEFEFSAKRNYFSDSTFSEQGIFRQVGKKTTVLNFKKVHTSWYIEEKGRWKNFYIAGQTISPTIILGSKKVKLVFERTSELFGQPCIIFKYTEIGFETGEQSYYWFNPDLGIVLIQANGFSLIRKDVLFLQR